MIDRRLLIATHNRGKVEELERILARLDIRIVCLSDIGIKAEIEETGETFRENASIKASGYSRLAGIPTLADDSGLVVDYLNGRPGVHSARYAGENASDAERIEKILSEVHHAKDEERGARFVCAISVSDETGNIAETVEGVCEGMIVGAPRGSNGFGYDPIFQPSGFDRTFGELDPEIKDNISHRARAVAKIIPFLQGFFNI